MSISIVNGYLCYDSCEAATARTGRDPHPAFTANQRSEGKPDTAGASGTPAVTYGGSLTGPNAVAPVGATAPTDATSNNPAPAGLDIRA